MLERSALEAVVRVRALFFAAYRDLVGARELVFELAAGSTVRDLIREVRARTARFPEGPAAAVNQEYAAASTVLEDGDEVAFIPPVAGG